MIAVLLATYNGEKYLEELLESLRLQTYQDFCVYAHDDGSRDATPLILKKWAEEYPAKVKVISGEPTGGAKNNFFYLLKNVSAKYYMFCDQDDIWKPDKIEKTVRKLKDSGKSSSGPVLVHADLTVTDSDAKIIADRMSVYQRLDNSFSDFNHLLIQNTVTGCTTLINEKLKQLALMAEDKDDIIMHDWWLALIAAKFGEIIYVDEPLILYRQHEGNSVGAKSYRSFAYKLKRLFARDEIKNSLRATRRQAELFARTFEEKEDSLASEYAYLAKKGKLARMKFYRENKVTKQGLARKIGLILFG